jgi:cyclopropane fatty-acyl-phospholipid synthase-like methyltransferase
VSLSQRLSAAAHSNLPHANPLSSVQMDRLARSLARRGPRTILEIGCGPGTFAIGLAKICPASITAIDVNTDFLTRARNAALEQGLAGRIDFCLQDAASLGAQRFAAVVCVGSSQAFGTALEALEHCAALTEEGGSIVFADLVWSSEPPDAFLEFLGGPRSLYWSEMEAETVFQQAGLIVLQQETASRTSWQEYEAAVLAGRLAFADTLDGGEAEQVRKRARTWAAAFDEYGQYCFGFTAYLAARD